MKRLTARLAAAAITAVPLVALLAPTVVAQAAEAPNEGFESGLTGWVAGSGAAAVLVHDPVHSGVNAVALSRKTSSGAALLTEDPDFFTNVPAGNTCDASAWVLGPVGHKATVKWTAKSGTTNVTSVQKVVAFTGAWQLTPTTTLTMPSTASTADLQLVAANFPVGQNWFVDDIVATCDLDAPPPPPTPGPEPMDRAISSGLWDGVPFPTYGAYPADYNKDGLVDVLINPHNLTGGLRLFRNNGGGSFTQVYTGQFTHRSPSGAARNDRHGCAWGDANNDNLLDIFCTMGANHGTLTDKADELWIQQAGGGFLNRATDYGVTNPSGPGRAGVFLDVNHDGFQDLYVTSDTRTDGIASPYRLYINQNGQRYVDSPEYGVDLELGGLPDNQAPVQAVDYNKDGWMDLFAVTHKGLRLFLNNSGTGFTDATAASHLAAGVWLNAELTDLNNDGRLDVAGLNNNGSQFRVQIGSATGFGSVAASRTVTAGRQVAVGDVNADGTSDIYIVTGKTSPDIMMLNDGTGLHYVDIATPQATTGDGQSVTPFDHDQNGTVDMIVMHGYGSTKGPLQLISFPK